eukprot:INCI9546.1.p1 GENE.INCI9546.1~~INCI9546.1.p1  ORF type:complete len:1101 (+),score=113.65 INCI9546.1:123-3425(+)
MGCRDRCGGCASSATAAAAATSSLDWFWIRHGLLFPSEKRELAFFAYKTQSSTPGTLLLYFLSFVCFFVAAIAAVSLVTSAMVANNGILLRDMDFRRLSRSDDVVYWALVSIAIIFLVVAGAGSVVKVRRVKLWAACCWILGLWEAVFFAQCVLQPFGGGLMKMGPVYPFDSALLGAGQRRPPASSGGNLGDSAMCFLNFTGDVLRVNSSCSFNITTTAAAMMYSGFMDGSLSLSPQLIVPWVVVVVLAANGVMFQARQIVWLAVMPLCCLAISTFSIVGPASNFNFLNAIMVFIDCDPTFNYVFFAMMATDVVLLILTASILFNMTYIHERNVREMYFWTDFTRMRRNELSTQKNPFTLKHLSRWLHRHAGDDLDEDQIDGESLEAHPRVDMSVNIAGSEPLSFWEIDSAEVELVRKVAGGSAGTVWYARYRGKPVAAKVLHAFHMQGMGDQAAHELATETAILAQLRHANIVKFLGLCLAQGVTIEEQSAMIVTEWCPENLAEWLGTWRFAAELLETSIAIARGVRYLHLRGITHRDLKPPNVLVDGSGTIKICDFGISVGNAASSARSASFAKISSQPTIEVVGTPGFIAPEVYTTAVGSNLLGPVCQKVDVYAFGVLLWEIFANCGGREFECSQVQLDALQTDGEVHQRFVLEGLKVPDVALLDERCPKPVAVLMSCCWSTMQSQRPSFSDIVGTLSTQLHQLLAGTDNNSILISSSLVTRGEKSISQFSNSSSGSSASSLAHRIAASPMSSKSHLRHQRPRKRPKIPYGFPKTPSGSRSHTRTPTTSMAGTSLNTAGTSLNTPMLRSRQESSAVRARDDGSRNASSFAAKRGCCAELSHRVQQIEESNLWKRFTCKQCWVGWGLQFQSPEAESEFQRRVVANDRFFATVRVIFLLVAAVYGASGIYLATVLYERPMGDPQLFGDVELKLRFVPGKNWQARPSLRHFIKIQQTSKSCMDRDSMRLDAAFAFAGLLALAGLCFCWLYGQQLLHSCTICTHAGQLRAPFWWRPLFVLLPLRWEHTMRKPTPRLGCTLTSLCHSSTFRMLIGSMDLVVLIIRWRVVMESKTSSATVAYSISGGAWVAFGAHRYWYFKMC